MTADQCSRKAKQHWEMAGLAHQDNDLDDAARHTTKARLWDQRAAMGGYDVSDNDTG